LTWSGDWRAYRRLTFDLNWTGQQSLTNTELVRIFGANGHTLSWSNSVTKGVWTNYTMRFVPESFGVDAAEMEAVLAHVSSLWIFGEFGTTIDTSIFDNIVLSTSTNGPTRFTQSLVSRFDAGNEGWTAFDNAAGTWLPTNGFSGGAFQSRDNGSGTARFHSPETWVGDWRNFKTLRFFLLPETVTIAGYATTLSISTWDGRSLQLTLPKALGSWTPYTVDLTPGTFGVSTNDFEAIMSDVAGLWILADLTGSADATLLDDVMLLTDAGAGIPPDRFADFESGAANWRQGEWQSGNLRWEFGGTTTHVPTNGNPGGYIQNTDTGDWTFWFSPSSWAGDWRGIPSVSFDFKIFTGTSLFETWMLSVISTYTNLNADVVTLPVPGQWQHYEFALTPAAFGVSPADFDRAMRDVVALGIRSEWIIGSDREGLDNVRISKASDAYWAWISGYYSGTNLANEQITGNLADPDGDGMNNWSEFIAGTVPTNRLDFLRIEHVAVTNSTCLLDFNSRTGRLYGVERATAISPTNTWSTVTNEIPGSGLLQTVPVSAGSNQQFYRLKVRRSE